MILVASLLELVTEKYQYWLEVDSTGKIVGGDYESWDRPDFGWSIEISDFRDFFSGLKEVYQHL